MSGPSFSSILDEELTEEVNRPKPMPVGSYQWVIPAPHREDKSKGKQTPFIEWNVTCQAALDDVDEAALEEFGSPQGKQNRLTFYLTEDAMWRLDAFLREVLQLDAGLTRRQALAEAVGRSFIGKIRHETSQDGTQVFARIGDTAAL